jgi:hypothetical protein
VIVGARVRMHCASERNPRIGRAMNSCRLYR